MRWGWLWLAIAGWLAFISKSHHQWQRTNERWLLAMAAAPPAGSEVVVVREAEQSRWCDVQSGMDGDDDDDDEDEGEWMASRMNSHEFRMHPSPDIASLTCSHEI